MTDNKITFISNAHHDFFVEMMGKCEDDASNRAFFYLMGMSEETRNHIDQLYDFSNGYLKPKRLSAAWQTSGTLKICHLAYNLWNGYVDKKNAEAYTPNELFDTRYARYFVQAIRLQYPNCF